MTRFEGTGDPNARRTLRLAGTAGATSFVVLSLHGALGLPIWMAVVLVLAATTVFAFLAREEPPRPVLVERVGAVYPGQTNQSPERVMRRKDFFPELSARITYAAHQGALYTTVIVGLRPSRSASSLKEVLELRLETFLASHFKGAGAIVGRLGGCSYAIGLGGLSQDESQAALRELRDELADMFAGRARPYLGSTAIVAGDDAQSAYERTLHARRTISANPLARLLYWTTRS